MFIFRAKKEWCRRMDEEGGTLSHDDTYHIRLFLWDCVREEGLTKPAFFRWAHLLYSFLILK